jgi:hypothetical protein
MAHQATVGILTLGWQSRFNRDNWLEKIQDFPRKNVCPLGVFPHPAQLWRRRLTKER